MVARQTYLKINQIIFEISLLGLGDGGRENQFVSMGHTFVTQNRGTNNHTQMIVDCEEATGKSYNLIY